MAPFRPFDNAETLTAEGEVKFNIRFLDGVAGEAGPWEGGGEKADFLPPELGGVILLLWPDVRATCD
jgi:hypothetical protein